MKKNHLFIFLLLLSCTTQRAQKECLTFNEAVDPQSNNLTEWKNIPKGLQVSFTNIDTKYAKSEVPELTNSLNTQLTAWKGESVSAQLLLWSSDSIQQIECEFSDFKSNEAVLDKGIAKARFVRYVLTDIFAPGCGYRKPEDFPSSLTQDMLDNIECMDINANTVRPVWLTFDVPESAKEGKYLAKLNVYARNTKKITLHIELNIQNKVLPPAREWGFHLDLWQHPSASARTANVPMWSKEHFDVMKPLFTMLANAGQKVITATLNKDPWNNQCYDKYEDMIIWTKNEDGSWKYDYSIFDKWIEFMIGLGIDKQINCYSMIPWNNEIHYTDAKSNSIINVVATPGTKDFEIMWKPFLSDFITHLRGKGWLNITNIAMDERSPETMKAVMTLLGNVAPELGIALADNHKSYKQYPHIKDMCIALGSEIDSADLALRKQKNLITTYYVCCSHDFPNVFTFSGPAEAVYCAWYAEANQLDGFLRWAYNSWVENPLVDSRFRTWPAGDTYMVYPDARSSIRFERLREGIQDVEKIKILRRDLIEAGKTADLQRLNEELAKFKIVNPSENYVLMINKAKELICELSGK